MPIRIDLLKDGTNVGNILVDEYLELGRRDKSDIGEVVPFLTRFGNVARWVVTDTGGANKVPRKVCGLEYIDGNRVRVSNIHTANRELWIQKGESKVQILPGDSIDKPLPVTVRLPEGLAVEIALVEISEIEAEQGTSHPEFNEQVNSILGGSGTSLSFSSGSSFLSQSSIGGSHTVFSKDSEVGENSRLFLQAMSHVIPALQEPINSPKYLQGIAEAVIRVMDMDRVEIITRKDGKWIYDDTNQFLRSKSLEPELPSRNLLERVLATGKLSTYPDEEEDCASESLMEMQTAIASPLMDPTNPKGGLLGVLYADRRCKMGSGRSASISKDEKGFIAILSAATANRLGNVKKEQELHTYQQFFSQKVIANLLEKGDAFLDGKDTEVSVLFCDIRGFSKATDSMEANAAMQWLSDTLSELSQVVLDADGVLVDYVGDELFAMWGAPDEDPSHGYSAIRAALQMMEIKRMLNERYQGKISFKIDFGIGLNTGKARVGNTGSRQKFKYGPMGRTVNLGSRIQGLTKQWQVSTLMAESTAECVPPDTPKRRLCQAKVVGLDGHVNLYQLMSQQEANDDLISRYAEGLALFESGKQFRQSAKLFGELVQRHPEDGPSLIMLERSVSQLVHPIGTFSPVWEAFTK
ncbi:MAG: adenylate/guanylate cyclase domain-containing protein [Planctomycetota bacterium]|nr:adenylate/guanylate cyclase domain-containing protein [Planctomycetota bacterium]